MPLMVLSTYFNLLKLRSSEIVKSELDKVDITQDGTTVEITYTTTVDDLKQLMDAVRNLTSPTM